MCSFDNGNKNLLKKNYINYIKSFFYCSNKESEPLETSEKKMKFHKIFILDFSQIYKKSSEKDMNTNINYNRSNIQNSNGSQKLKCKKEKSEKDNLLNNLEYFKHKIQNASCSSKQNK